MNSGDSGDQKRVLDPLGARITGVCELQEVSSGNQTQVLCKHSAHSNVELQP